LEHALGDQEIKAEAAERELQAFKRGLRMSIRPPNPTTDTFSGPLKPKVKEPWVYYGGYDPLKSVLSWALRMERYCFACKVPLEDYSIYAESYMTHSVQKWMMGIWLKGYPAWIRQESSCPNSRALPLKKLGMLELALVVAPQTISLQTVPQTRGISRNSLAR
jgi:hypothetical protein